jgi:hypothetical protein
MSFLIVPISYKIVTLLKAESVYILKAAASVHGVIFSVFRLHRFRR